MQQGGQGKPSVEKLFENSCRNREREIGEQLHRGLRQDPFRKGLERASRSEGKFPSTPQFQPLKSRNRRGPDDRGDKNSASVRNGQTKLRGRKSVSPCAPCHYCDREPLKGNGRGVERKPLRSADLRHRQQFFRPRSSTPRQDHAEHEKNQPDVPGHPRMRTLSAGPCK